MRANKHHDRVARGLLRVAILCALAPPCSHAGEFPEDLPTPPIVVGNLPPQVRPLSLEEAKERALSVSPVLSLARTNVQEKQAALRAVHADYLPKILGMFADVHYDQPLGSVFTLQSGLSVPVNIVNQDQTFGMVTAAQPVTALLKVRGLSRVTAADGRIARANVEEARRAILSGVEQVYVGLWAAQRVQTLASAGVTATKSWENGSPEMQAAYLESLQGMQAATGQVNQLQDQMNDLLAFPPDTTFVLADLCTPAPEIGTADQAVCLAVNSSPEVREALQQVEKAAAALGITKTDYLPDANLMGGYVNQNGIPSVQNNIGFAAVTVSYTMFDAGKRRHLTQKGQYDLAMARAAVGKTQQEVSLKARKAFHTVESTAIARETASKLAGVRRRIAAQQLPPAELITAGKNSATAEVAYIQSEVAYRIAVAELKAVTGAQ